MALPLYIDSVPIPNATGTSITATFPSANLQVGDTVIVALQIAGTATISSITDNCVTHATYALRKGSGSGGTSTKKGQMFVWTGKLVSLPSGGGAVVLTITVSATGNAAGSALAYRNCDVVDTSAAAAGFTAATALATGVMGAGAGTQFDLIVSAVGATGSSQTFTPSGITGFTSRQSSAAATTSVNAGDVVASGTTSQSLTWTPSVASASEAVLITLRNTGYPYWIKVTGAGSGATAGSSSSVSVTPTAIGTVLGMLVTLHSSTCIAVSDGTNGSYTKLASQAMGASGEVSFWAKANQQATAAVTIQATFAASTLFQIQGHEFGGADLVSPFHIPSPFVATGSGTALTGPNLTPNVAGELAVAIYGDAAGTSATLTPTSPWTQAGTSYFSGGATGSQVDLGLFYDLVTSTATVAFAGTLATTESWSLLGFGLLPPITDPFPLPYNGGCERQQNAVYRM